MNGGSRTDSCEVKAIEKTEWEIYFVEKDHEETNVQKLKKGI